ncbi:MAG: hypothetical protein AAF978_09365 [Cyanobacteria bacterium P01_E01_bin.48]
MTESVTTPAQHRAHIISVATLHDIDTSDDGYCYFFTQRGALSAADLRIIADELDRRNEAWDKQVKEDLKA